MYKILVDEWFILLASFVTLRPMETCQLFVGTKRLLSDACQQSFVSFLVRKKKCAI